METLFLGAGLPLPVFVERGLRCAIYGVGIIAMLVSYGMLQQRILAVSYDSDYFTVSVFLVFCNRVVAICFALVMLHIRGEPFRSSAPLWKCLAISFSNVAASTFQYDAMTHISFQLQTVGKGFKMIPVMLWGMVLTKKRYAVDDWLVAIFVTVGVSQFLLHANAATHHSTSNSLGGLMLLLLYLVLDGFTPSFQEKLFVDHAASKYSQMLYINFCSASVSFASLAFSDGLKTALSFCVVHPALLRDVILLSVAAVGGQWFIYSQIKEFGAVVFAATINLRQVASILVTYLVYGHALNGLQVSGLIMVLGALFFNGYRALVYSQDDETLPLFKQRRRQISGF